ncbi:hypothetical protein [Enterocloster hominis (ex Hitch et al. 2024)]|uniref:Uncharacterized protein n=1 Tax=Enterocloster hominis (ex Hitch et al. 2024) TaxID=1917870 RepID=A0ABV1D536_9FIRM
MGKMIGIVNKKDVVVDFLVWGCDKAATVTTLSYLLVKKVLR